MKCLVSLSCSWVVMRYLLALFIKKSRQKIKQQQFIVNAILSLIKKRFLLHYLMNFVICFTIFCINKKGFNELWDINRIPGQSKHCYERKYNSSRKKFSFVWGKFKFNLIIEQRLMSKTQCAVPVSQRSQQLICVWLQFHEIEL